MYNDPDGALCLSSAFYSLVEKEGIGAEVRMEEHIKGQARAGTERPTLSSPSPGTADTPVRLQPHYQNNVAHLPDPSLRRSCSEMYFLDG